MLIKCGNIWSEGFVKITDIPDDITQQQFEQLLDASFCDHIRVRKDRDRYYVVNNVFHQSLLAQFIIFIPQEHHHPNLYRVVNTSLTWAQFTTRYDIQDDFE